MARTRWPPLSGSAAWSSARAARNSSRAATMCGCPGPVAQPMANAAPNARAAQTHRLSHDVRRGDSMPSPPVRFAVLVIAFILDAPVNLGDGRDDPLDRLDAMATLVGGGRVELGLGQAQVLARRHHVRLIGGCPAGKDAGEHQGAEDQGAADTTDGGVRLGRHGNLQYEGEASSLRRRRRPDDELAQSLSRHLETRKVTSRSP